MVGGRTVWFLVGVCISIVCCAVRLLMGCSQGGPRSASVLENRLWGRKEWRSFPSHGLLSDSRLERVLSEFEAIGIFGMPVHDGEVDVS